MKNEREIKVVFWALVGMFGVFLSTMFLPEVLNIFRGMAFLLLMAEIFFLGGLLVLAVRKSKIKGNLRKYLLLTGGSAVGFFVFGVLHNLTSALLGVEEPVFFLLAVIGCPIGFLVGGVGSIRKII